MLGNNNNNKTNNKNNKKNKKNKDFMVEKGLLGACA